MGLILRVDVDKPYGHHQPWRKVLSKVVEDYVPRLPQFPGYLSHLREFVKYCNKNSIPGIFFHRLCTVPDVETKELYKLGNHELGLHLEDSRSQDAVFKEYQQFKSIVNDLDIRYFSKHGSGSYKLGKYHEPSYKPDLYREWSKLLPINLHSGNAKLQSLTEMPDLDGFHPAIFWVEIDYREGSLLTADQLIEIAKKRDVVVLIHPSNFVTDVRTRSEFFQIVDKTKESNVAWVKI